MKWVLFILSFLLVLNIVLCAEEPLSDEYLQGYAGSVWGNTLTYHSPHPEVNRSLLVRSLDSKQHIRWKTETVPVNYNKEFVSFIWMFGIDVNVDSHGFDLYVNDEKQFTFYNPKSTDNKTWALQGKNGASLTFRATMIDKYGDFMGFAIMKIPTAGIKKENGLEIKVVGETAGSRSWYMTFESGVKREISFHPEPVLVKKNGESMQTLRVHMVHLGERVNANLDVGDYIKKKFILEPGFNNIRLELPETEKTVEYTAGIAFEGRERVVRTFKLEPVRKWRVRLVQHTHTDIGYTRPQTEILPEHLRFIDYALDFCDRTDDYPEDAKFRWTCESSWAVREFLNSRPPKQVRRLIRRIREGRIEVTGMFFNLSEIMDEASLAAQLQPVREFRRRGIPVKTAMQNDINGIGWCLADYFKDMGIEYLIMGEHGHRALIPFEMPTLFWWESPSGQRVLAFRGEHYMTGNKMGIHTGNLETFEPALLKYLENLEKKGYPFNEIALQYSGYVTDNSPPGLTGCDVIRRWNETHEWPKLRSATATEFMEYMDKNHSSKFGVYRRAWPDWWSDGFGSAARETAAARLTQAGLTATEGLLAMAMLKNGTLKQDVMDRAAAIRDDLIFYNEHTFGAAESIRDPRGENNMVQWAEKAAYVWEAVKKERLLRETAMGWLQPHLPRAGVPTIAVFNTLNRERTGLVRIYIDHEILSPNREFRILDDNGNEMAAQAMGGREDGTYWGLWVENIPPVGYKTFRIESRQAERKKIQTATPSGILENEFYKLVMDTGTGAVKSLADKELGRELVDSSCSWRLGQLIYERLSQRQQLESFKLLETPERTSPRDVKLEKEINGPIWRSVFITGYLPECAEGRVTCEIRLFHGEKRIEFHYGMRKRGVTEPEAVYVAFPFAMPGSELRFQAQGGMVRPGKDQLAGTSSDWNVIQDVAVIGGPEGQIAWGSREIPLAHLGGLNIGNFKYVSKPSKGHIFSWVMNNYWTTNFQASQEGEFKWSYYLTSSKDGSAGFAGHFGQESRVPLLARVLPPGKKNLDNKRSASLLGLTHPGIALVNLRPAYGGKGIVLHLREMNGKGVKLRLDNLLKGKKYKSVRVVNVLEEPLSGPSVELSLKPYESRFIKIDI